MKLTNILYGLSVILFLPIKVFSQEEFQKKLYLDIYHEQGKEWHTDIKGWELPYNSKESFLNNQLWGHILAKSVLDSQRIVVTPKELEYFAKLSNIDIQYIGDPVCVPKHWENKFEKLIQPVSFSQPLKALVIYDKKVQLITIDSLIGLQYYTFYPYSSRHNSDTRSVPIIYKLKKPVLSNANMILLISDYALTKLNIDKTNLAVDSISINDFDYPSALKIRKIDLDNNLETDIIMFEYRFYDAMDADDPNEPLLYINHHIAMYHKKIWYSSSFSFDGMDGIEGF